MKRHAALIGLSQDHHHGLVLARRCQSEAIDWDEVSETFTKELAPHFDIEEKLLLPPLGEDPLVARTLSEHAALRAQLTARGSLADFGKLLADHIRFEERELFKRAQVVLTDDQLTRIDQACPKLAER